MMHMSQSCSDASSCLHALVVEDEPLAASRLRSLLAGIGGLEVIGEVDNGPDAVRANLAQHPDLVFLDVQIPDLDGFGVLAAVRDAGSPLPAVVFVTAYDRYAMRALEVHAVDYLLKPFSRERLAKAVQRAALRVDARQPDRDALARQLAAVQAAPRYLERLLVRSGDRLYFVPVADVLRFEADGNYIKLHTATGTHLVRETMSALESQLDPARFARIHRSEIVAIDAVKEIQPYFHGDHVVVLKSGARVRMSRRFQHRLLP